MHINEPGRTEWEGFDTATMAAAAAGVTTLIDMPLNSLPPTLTAAALATKKAAARGHCRVDTGFWGGAVPTNLADLPELFAAGVFGVKCFLQDSGVPEFPPLSPAELAAAMTVIAGLDGLLLVHAEDPAVLHVSPTPLGRDYRAFVASRPDTAEAAAVETVIETVAGDGLPGAHRAPVVGGRCGPDPPGQGRRGPDHRRDLPALPDAGRRGRSRTVSRSTSAARRSAAAPTRTRCGRRCWTAPSTSSSPTIRRPPRS